MSARRFDAIVVGAGQAGPPLAMRLAKAGRQVAMIERSHFGGTCVNTGCTPTKALVASAHAAHLARRAADYGVTLGGAVGINFTAVMARKDRILLDSRNGVEKGLRDTEGCTVYEGHARFESATELRVGDALLTAPRVFLDVGARATMPDMPGADTVRLLTNVSILQLTELPRHLVVIGGSYIGLEFAQMFRRFGAEVTVIERGKHLVAREDVEVADAIREILEAEGITVRLGVECTTFRPQGDDIAVGVECEGGGPDIVASHVLMAVGRRPNTDDLGVETAGIELDEKGYIRVDDQLRTTASGVWALGDCNGEGAFTHTAYNDYEIVADNLLDGASRRVSDRIETYALYIDPPLGRAGMTEAQAKKAGHAVKIGRRPMTKVSRAKEKGETQGLMKLVVDAKSDAILGAAILGVGGDEAIHAVLDTMAAGRTATDLQHTMHIHPTVAELLPTVAGDLEPADPNGA